MWEPTVWVIALRYPARWLLRPCADERKAELQRRVPRAPGTDRRRAAPRRVLRPPAQARAADPRRHRRRDRRGDPPRPGPRLAARSLQRRPAGLARVRRAAGDPLLRLLRDGLPWRLLRPHELA